MHLANKINKWVHSGPYANYAEIDPVTAAVLAAGVSAGSTAIKSMSARKKAVKELKARRKEQLKGLDQASQMSAEEQQAMARMRKGAEQGTMDVAKLNQQIAQPLYQQGEAQEAQAMQKITQQGLEGSIIAQDVSRKVGSDVRASIAQQARQIAMDNERTKADAARRLSQAQMQRGQLLRDIAIKRGQVEADYRAGRAAQPSDLDIYGNYVMDLGQSLTGSMAGGAFEPGATITPQGSSAGGGVTKRDN
tara:strand:- start:2708 stop:3454 length:747 start_codon:yes stop_codon:yes gene_type:complete